MAVGGGFGIAGSGWGEVVISGKGHLHLAAKRGAGRRRNPRKDRRSQPCLVCCSSPRPPNDRHAPATQIRDANTTSIPHGYISEPPSRILDDNQNQQISCPQHHSIFLHLGTLTSPSKRTLGKNAAHRLDRLALLRRCSRRAGRGRPAGSSDRRVLRAQQRPRNLPRRRPRQDQAYPVLPGPHLPAPC